MTDPTVLDHHAALVYVMVLVSASDGDMTDAELSSIGGMVQHLPIFRDYDEDLLPSMAENCTALLDDDEGLEAVLALVAEALPEHLHETAYALACDVAAADGALSQEELRLLEIIRYRLEVGRLPAAAIERGAKARHAVL